MSIASLWTPADISASSTALAMATDGEMTPLSPTPLMPRSFTAAG